MTYICCCRVASVCALVFPTTVIYQSIIFSRCELQGTLSCYILTCFGVCFFIFFFFFPNYGQIDSTSRWKEYFPPPLSPKQKVALLSITLLQEGLCNLLKIRDTLYAGRKLSGIRSGSGEKKKSPSWSERLQGIQLLLCQGNTYLFPTTFKDLK